MDAGKNNFLNFILEEKIEFIIPIYQRNYDWQIRNCEQLLKDIDAENRHHFFGTIVYLINNKLDIYEYIIIDGQQRITTVILLLYALYNLYKNKKREITNHNVFNKLKLIFTKKDNSLLKLRYLNKNINLDSFLQDNSLCNKNIVDNYNFFYDYIYKNYKNIDDIYNKLEKLEIVKILVDKEDDPQRIFESINSTGVSLSEGDKIRNLILMDKSSNEQIEIYNKYWSKIEENTFGKISSFMRDYLGVIKKQLIQINSIYITFKHHIYEYKNMEIILEDLLEYSKIYKELLVDKFNGNKESNNIENIIFRLNIQEITVFRPFIMNLKYKMKKNEIVISDKEFTNILVTIESYILRRTICDKPSNVLNRFFILLDSDIYNLDNNYENYYNKFIYLITSQQDNFVFPDNEEFANKFSTRNMYILNQKKLVYILEKLNNGKSEEIQNFYNKKYSIEHIMPQKLSSEWENDLGENSIIIHNKWLHRIANLTLTAYNSKYSNNTFKEKCNIKDFGLKYSTIYLNQRIISIANEDCGLWREKELEKRNNELVQRAVYEIWKKPNTNYEYYKNNNEIYTLNSTIDFTNREIISVIIDNTKYSVSSWTNAYTLIIIDLYNKNKNLLRTLVLNNSIKYISFNKALFKNNDSIFELNNDLFIDCHSNTNEKVKRLKKLVELYNLDYEDYKLCIADEKESISRYNIRKQYWEYALNNYIKKSNNRFENINATKDNWVTSSTGVAGYYITCIANQNETRVELYIDTGDAGKNKLAFENLLSKKEEIEIGVGKKLIWNRADDKKSSKIYISLNGIGLKHQNNWEEMAKFHAYWTSKFYDTFIKYIN